MNGIPSDLATGLIAANAAAAPPLPGQKSIGDALIHQADIANATRQAENGSLTNKVLNASLATNKYAWKPPKTGFLATVFPSDANWHVLYDHSYGEIAKTMFNAQDENAPATVSDGLRRAIQQTVIDSYFVRRMSYCYKTLLVGLIIVIVMLMFKLPDVEKIAGLFIVVAAAFAIYAYATSENDGDAYWTDFSVDLGAKLGTGSTVRKVLDDYAAADNANKSWFPNISVGSRAYVSPRRTGRVIRFG